MRSDSTSEVAERYLKERGRIEANLRLNLNEPDEGVFQHLVEVDVIKRLGDLGYLEGMS